MTKNALLKEGQKIRAWVDPPPPYSGTARKKTFFFLRMSCVLKPFCWIHLLISIQLASPPVRVTSVNLLWLTNNIRLTFESMWELPLCWQNQISDCLLLSITTLAAAEILPVAIRETRSFARHTHTHTTHTHTHTFSILTISLLVVTILSVIRTYSSSDEFLLSQHFNFIIWNVNGGRTQSVGSGTSFSICSTAILFQIASRPLFLLHIRSSNKSGTICSVTDFSQSSPLITGSRNVEDDLPTFLCGCGSWNRWGSFLFSSSWRQTFKGYSVIFSEINTTMIMFMMQQTK